MILLGYLSVEEYPETETITISAHAATVCECVAVYLSVLNALWLRLQSAFIRFRMVFQSIHIAFRDSLAVIQHRPLRQQTKTIWFLQIVRNETMAHHSNVSFQWILNIYIHSRWTRFFLFVGLALCFFPYFHILFLLQFFFFLFSCVDRCDAEKHNWFAMTNEWRSECQVRWIEQLACQNGYWRPVFNGSQTFLSVFILCMFFVQDFPKSQWN